MALPTSIRNSQRGRFQTAPVETSLYGSFREIFTQPDSSMNSWMNILLVFLGGGCGSVGRWGISLWLKRYAATLWGLPVHTLCANMLGCFIIGLLTGWLSRNSHADLSLLLVTGFCGGFTTFSTFSLESFEMLRSGQTGLALVYVALSLVICVGAVAGGVAVMNCK